MISREFDAITKTDIEGLIENAVMERRTLEYKQQLPGDGDDDKRELLADVSSFANAGGGDIVYGVIEQRDGNGKPTGVPEKANGLAGINTDVEQRRLLEVIRTGIDPRISGILVRHVDGFAAGPIIVVRIPKSFASPHMVVFKNLSRFFIRAGAAKQQLDVREIGVAFSENRDSRYKIAAFRSDRLGKIISNEAPIELPNAPKIVLHLVPFAVLDPANQIDLTPLRNDCNLASPIQWKTFDCRNNIDGYLSYYLPRYGGQNAGYCQVFRSGAFEAVDTEPLCPYVNEKLVPSKYFENHLISATDKYLKTAEQIGVPLPLVIMVSILGVKGYAMATRSPGYNAHPKNHIDRDMLIFPEVVVEEYATLADVALKPILDVFWQSAGFSHCENYKEGRWTSD